MAEANPNAPVLCGSCGKAAAPWRARFPWGLALGVGWITGALGGLGIAFYHLRYADAVCGSCGKGGPFRGAPANAEVVASRRVHRAAGVLATLALVGAVAAVSISVLIEAIAQEDATGETDPTYMWTFFFLWAGVPLLAVLIAAGGRRTRVKAIERAQGASPAQAVAPPRQAPPSIQAAPPAPTAYDELPRLESLAQRHPNLADLPRLRERAAQGDAATLSLLLGEVEAKLAERAVLLRSAQENARKLGKLSERLADGELSESAFQSAKAHLEREAAATDERLRRLDGELFREEFEKPI